jgi:hypothetical protein
MGVIPSGTNPDEGVGAIQPKAQPPQTGLFRNIAAGFREAVAGPHSTQVGDAIYQNRDYDQIVKALNQEGEQGVDYVESPVLKSSPFYHPVEGERVNQNGVVYIPVKRSFRNPYVSAPSLTKDNNPLMALYGGGDRAEIDQIWSAVQRVRQRKPDFLKAIPNEAALMALALKRRQQDMASAQAVTSRASTAGKIGGFIGGMGGSIASMDPENAVGGIGGAAGKTVGRTILKRAVEGAVANTAAGVVAVPGQVADAEHLGVAHDHLGHSFERRTDGGGRRCSRRRARCHSSHCGRGEGRCW